MDKIKSGGSTLNLVVRRRKLEMPPIIQLGLEDKPEILQYPDRTEIKSDSRFVHSLLLTTKLFLNEKFNNLP